MPCMGAHRKGRKDPRTDDHDEDYMVFIILSCGARDIPIVHGNLGMGTRDHVEVYTLPNELETRCYKHQ